MPHISAKGMPSRKTRGHLGDIYTDTSTGDQFKCTGAYHMNVHGKPVYNYEWKFMAGSTNEPEKPIVERKDILEPEEPIMEPYTIVGEPIEETINEFANVEEDEPIPEVPRQDSRRDRSNYSKQYRNKKRNQ